MEQEFLLQLQELKFGRVGKLMFFQWRFFGYWGLGVQLVEIRGFQDLKGVFIMEGFLEFKQYLLFGGRQFSLSFWDSCYGILQGNFLSLFLDERMVEEKVVFLVVFDFMGVWCERLWGCYGRKYIFFLRLISGEEILFVVLFEEQVESWW